MKLLQSTYLIAALFPYSAAHDPTNLLHALHLLSTNEQLSRHLQFSLNDLGGCPETCSSPEICSYYETQASGNDLAFDSEGLGVLQGACDAGTLGECFPSMLESACGYCGDDSGGLLSAFLGDEEINTICDGCAFVECCDGGNFETCSDLLGDLEALVDESGGVSTSPVSLGSVSPSPGPIGFIEEVSSTVPTPSTLSEQEEEEFGEIDDFFGEGFNQSANGTDDFIGPWDSPFFTGVDDFFNESSTSSDDWLGGIFGVSFNESSTGSDDGFESAFGGMFDYNESGFGYDYDDFFGSILGGGCDESSNETDDFLGGILGGEFDSESGGAGLSDLLSGLMDSFGGLFGDMFGMMEGNETEWIDRGNITGWNNASMFGSFVCSEDTTCPIEGFCECLNGDIAMCSLTLLDDVCSSGSAFECAPDGFQEMCDTECPAPPRRLEDMEGNDVDIFTSPECSMCHVARCCDAEGTTLDECASEVGIDPQTILGSTEEGTYTNMTGLFTDDLATVFDEVIEDLMDNLTSVLDEFIGNISMPMFCPSGTCAVDGFCECFTGDFTQCTEQVLSESCTSDAFFECGPEDWDNFCSTECDGVVESLGDVVNIALCSVCAISKCCKDHGSDDCVLGNAPLLANYTTGFLPDSGLASVSSASEDPTTPSPSSTESVSGTESETEADTEAEDSNEGAGGSSEGSGSGEAAEQSVLEETQPANAESTASDTEAETDSVEVIPQFFCASSWDELETSCATAQNCTSEPCPPGIFCFQFNCDDAMAEEPPSELISAAREQDNSSSGALQMRMTVSFATALSYLYLMV